MDPKPSAPSGPAPADLELLHGFLDRAIAGDAASLDRFFSLLKNRYEKLVFKKLRRHRGYSHTSTVEDVVQEALVDLLGQIRRGELSGVVHPERRSVLAHFQKMCDQKLENLKKPRKDPLFARAKEEVRLHLSRDLRTGRQGDLGPPETATRRHRQMLDEEIADLDSPDRSLLLKHLSRVSYRQLSAETGRSVSALQSRVHRLKLRIAERLAERSLTAFLHQDGEDRPDPREAPPTGADIREALELLPLETKEALKAVHLDGLSVEALGRRLGREGLEKARSRLKRGYDTLGARLGVPFPESFSVLSHA